MEINKVLNAALQFLTNRINEEFHQEGVPEVAAVSSPVNEKGEPVSESGKLSVSLVNIDEERIFKEQLQREKRNGDSTDLYEPEIKLNLFVLVAANPYGNNYTGALDALNGALNCFQSRPVFEQATVNGIDVVLEKLIVELYSLSFEQQNQLWTSLGAKYMPSVVYRVRLVVIDADRSSATARLVREIDNELHKIN